MIKKNKKPGWLKDRRVLGARRTEIKTTFALTTQYSVLTE